MVNDPTAETGDEEPSNQVLLEETQARLREIFSWLQKMLEIRLEMSITSRKCWNPSIKSSLKISKLPWSLSQVWISITWQ
jgi:uncharacterized protein (DUF2132 family)